MKIISFVNFKGGVGKTTSTISVGSELAKRGNRVLMIDFDPQGSLSSSIGSKEMGKENDYTTKFLNGEIGWKTTTVENLFIVPTNIQLVRTQEDLRDKHILQKQLKNIDFDYVLIDCNPSVNILNDVALIASDFVIIPIKLDLYSIEGFDLLQEKIHEIKERFNPKLELLGIIETMKRNTKMHDEVHAFLKESNLGDLLFDTAIRVNTKIEEAQLDHSPVNIYSATSAGAKDYQALTDEIERRVR